jgi:hypothetical protein
MVYAVLAVGMGIALFIFNGGQSVKRLTERLARRLLVSILRSLTVNSEVFMMMVFGMIVAGYLVVSLIDEMF